MVLAVHVNDAIVAGSNTDCDCLHKHLDRRFPTNKLGVLTHHIGCRSKFDQKNNSITVSQEAYI